MARAQLDMFDEQTELLPEAPAVAHPRPDRVRLKLQQFLNELRASDRMPWDSRRQAYVQLVFPQMARVLPADEAEQFRLDFDREISRLG